MKKKPLCTLGENYGTIPKTVDFDMEENHGHIKKNNELYQNLWYCSYM